MTASGREHPKGCESKYSTYSQIPYQQSTRIQLHVPKRTPAGAPPGGAALPFMSPTTRTLSILTGPLPRGRPRSPRQAAVRSSAPRPSPRAGRGPPALAQGQGSPPARAGSCKDDQGHRGTGAGSASRHGGGLGRVHPHDRVPGIPLSYRTGCTRRHGGKRGPPTGCALLVLLLLTRDSDRLAARWTPYPLAISLD